MARTAQQSMAWLPIPTDIYTDTISQGLRATFGSHAIGIRIALMLAIARQGYYAVWGKTLRFAIADQVPGHSAAHLDEIVRFLVDNGEYDAEAFASDSVLTSAFIQQAWLRCKKGRRTVDDAPFWLADSQNCGAHNARKSAIMAPTMHDNTPISAPKSTQKDNNKNIYISPYVDIYIQKDQSAPTSADDDEPKLSSSKFPDLDKEIAALAADDPWVEHMAMQHHMPRQEILDTLHTFRDTCIERGKTAHRSVDDTKQHFVNWLNRRQYSSNPQKSTDNGRINQRNSSRRSTITPGYGLARS